MYAVYLVWANITYNFKMIRVVQYPKTNMKYSFNQKLILDDKNVLLTRLQCQGINHLKLLCTL